MFRYMQLKAVLVIGTVLIASVAIGSAAFTSGQVDRTATVSVVGDDAAATGLAPGGGTGSGVVQYDTNNQLTIDFAQMSTDASGVNAEANYTVGDSNAANETFAFNMTNNDGSAHDYSLSYAYDNKPSTNSSVTFTAYTYDSTNDAWTSAGSSFTLSAGETAYIVMEVDSTGAVPGDALSGTLSVTAT